MIKKIKLLIPTLSRLGFLNILRVVVYRLAIKFNIYSLLYPVVPWRALGNVFDEKPQDISTNKQTTSKVIVGKAEQLLSGDVTMFGHLRASVGSPPKWLQNPLKAGHVVNENSEHWSKTNEFADPNVDIKLLWELSRFDWALVFARAYRETLNVKYINALNSWVEDWSKHNMPNCGANWKCGQEASIRMMQLLLATFIIDQHKKPSPFLVEFIYIHCSRINQSLSYAVAQNNNHGTSEAAALFIGGAWLSKYSGDTKNLKSKALKWQDAGRKLLENRVFALFMDDGSFSQYSLNYHRVALDTLCQAEFWRNELSLENFTSAYNDRIRLATNWLYQMIDAKTGLGPNFGANDGARLFVLSDTEYSDYRPTVQLASALFYRERAYNAGSWDKTLDYLNVVVGDKPSLEWKRNSTYFKEGGYITMVPPSGGVYSVWGILREANFKFRPSQEDVLHFDLWVGGVNVFRDAGSYSYNTQEPWQSYFPGVEAHNTIQFDNHGQMPRISRFLYAAWPEKSAKQAVNVEKENPIVSSYEDWTGANHKRTVSLCNNECVIVDEISGFKEEAALRWRLPQLGWKLNQELLSCSCEKFAIHVACDQDIESISLVKGWESTHYMKKNEILVLEIKCSQAVETITTKITWK